MKRLAARVALGSIVLQTVACLQVGSSERQLQELGSISVPSRLETTGPFEEGSFALFSFDRSALWPIGSNRPVPERLVVAVWTAASHDTARAAAIKDAQDRTEQIQWRRDGEYQVGEGIHSVNTAVNPTWVLVREFPDKSLTIAYMVWKKDSPLADARAIIANVAESFRPGLSPAEYLAIARERPGQMRQARMHDLDTALAARGVRLTLDGDAVERNGSVYALYNDERLGKSIAALHILGDLPLAERYTHLRPPPPNGIGNWPSVVWFEKNGAEWEHHGVDSDFRLPAQMTVRVAQLHANAAHRAHFYSVEIGTIDDLGMPALDLEFFDRASRAMAKLFKQGKLIEQRRD